MKRRNIVSGESCKTGTRRSKKGMSKWKKRLGRIR
jgi:hypothetical protein